MKNKITLWTNDESWMKDGKKTKVELYNFTSVKSEVNHYNGVCYWVIDCDGRLYRFIKTLTSIGDIECY